MSADSVADRAVIGAGPAALEQVGGPRLRQVVEWNDSLLSHAVQLIRHRELLWMVTQREVKVRYKQTTLGALWALLQPVALMLVFTLFFSVFAGLNSGDVPYPLFSYIALLPWTFFATALSFAIPSLITNSHIITRIYFPREIIPLACVLAALVDFAIASLAFVVMLLAYHIQTTWNLLYVAPILFLQVEFTCAVCLLLSAFTVLYRDARFMLPLLIQLWMFATPVLYSLSVIPARFRGVYLAINPMAVVIDSYRRAVLSGRTPDLVEVAIALGISTLLLWVAYRYFKHLEHDFADII
jgi:lipopolysaccharide transport system permease protein